MSLLPSVTLRFRFTDGDGAAQHVAIDWDVHDTSTSIATLCGQLVTLFKLPDAVAEALRASADAQVHAHALNLIRLQGREVMPWTGVPGYHRPFPPGTTGAASRAVPGMPTLAGTAPAAGAAAQSTAAGATAAAAPSAAPTPGGGLVPFTARPFIVSRGGRSRGFGGRGGFPWSVSGHKRVRGPGRPRKAGGGRGGGARGGAAYEDDDGVEDEDGYGGGSRSGVDAVGDDGDGAAGAAAAGAAGGGDDDGNVDYCVSCSHEGDLLCCDRCPRSYHSACAGYASVDDVPDGDWFCPECRRGLGSALEREGTTAGPLCNAFWDGPFTGHAPRYCPPPPGATVPPGALLPSSSASSAAGPTLTLSLKRGKKGGAAAAAAAGGGAASSSSSSSFGSSLPTGPVHPIYDVRLELVGLLEELRDHEFAPNFLDPIPRVYKHYHRLVRRPMDLGSIHQGVMEGTYGGGPLAIPASTETKPLSVAERVAGAAAAAAALAASGTASPPFDAVRLISDLRLVFHNCRHYNKPMSTIWRFADWLFRVVETALRDRIALGDDEAARLKSCREEELLPLTTLAGAVPGFPPAAGGAAGGAGSGDVR